MSEVLPLTGLHRCQIAGRWTKAFAAPLNMGVDVLTPLALVARTAWNGTGLPFPYAANYPQPFVPFTWGRNAIWLAATIKASGEVSPQVAEALTRLRADVEAYRDADWRILYRFAKQQSRTVKVTPAPWTSALGNAFVVMGALELASAGLSEWADVATNAMRPILLGTNDTPLVMLDEASWLWFEETPAVEPLTGGPAVPTHILNGHVGAVFALYRALQLRGPDPVLDLHVRAGAATAATYYQRTRNPGRCMSYWTYDDTPDYGPLRAINMTETLGAMTGNPMFGWLRDAFMTDVPVHK